ncbi:MAG: transposase [Arenicella sp.]
MATLFIEKRTLAKGNYHDTGHEIRQVVELKISRFVTAYRAQVLENEHGNRYVAEFPEGITRPIQYGASVKANAVYMPMFQLIPYQRPHYYCSMNMKLSYPHKTQ